MARIGSLTRGSLVEEVEQAIRALIYDQGLRPGDPLPTEHELGEVLGVSRNSLREALKVLQTTGAVAVRRGRGTIVGEMSLHALTSELVFHARLSVRDGTKELQNLIDLRWALENSLIEHACSLMTPSDLAAIESAVDVMEADARAGHFSPNSDKAFHERLYRPLDNPFVSQLLSAFWDVFASLEDDLPEGDDPPTKIAEQHRAIYTILAAGDLRGTAAMLLTTHFDGIKDRLFQKKVL